MIKSVLSIAMLMAVLSIAACGGPGAQQSNAPSPGDGTEETGASAEQASAASNSEETPDFDLTTLEGASST